MALFDDSDDPSFGTFAYIRQPLKSSVVRQAIPCNIGGTTSVISKRQEVVLVKDNVLELKVLDLSREPALWKTAVEQHVFGQIKDVKLVRLGASLSGDRMDTGGEESREYLACTSDSGYLSFLSFRFHGDDTGRFYNAFEVPIANPGLDYKDLGHSLAVDLLSRAIVASSLGGAFRLWPITNPANGIINNDEGITMYEEGVIWQIAFLHSAADPDLVRFVLTKSLDGVIAIVLYEYHIGQPLKEIRRWSPHIIVQEAVPLHLFAVSDIPGGFVLITDCDMHFIHASREGMDVLELPALRSSSENPERQMPVAATTSVVVNDSRNMLQDDVNQVIYVATEQQHLFRIEVTGNPRAATIQYITEIGHSGRALSLLAQDNENGVDYLATFGDLCDGELLSIRPAAEMIDPSSGVATEFTISNLSPILDFVLADLHREGHDAVLFTSGGGSRGSIKEIRNGIGVTVHASVKDGLQGAVALWNLKNRLEDKEDAFLVVSFLEETRVMSLSGGELEDMGPSAVGFNTNVPTIYAATSSIPGYFVQIHKGAVVIASSYDINGSTNDFPVQWQPEAGSIANGSVVDDLIVVWANGEIVILKIDGEKDKMASCVTEVHRMALDSAPSCIYCMRTSFQHSVSRMCVIGTYDPAFIILSLDEGKTLEPIYHASLAQIALQSIGIPHSFALLTSGQHTLLLAGLRDGTLAAMRLSQTAESSLTISTPAISCVGLIPVQLVTGASNYALAFSDRAWKIDVEAADGELKLTGVSLSRALHATPFSYGNIEHGFMILSKGTMHFVELEGAKSNNIRSLDVDFVPRRILFDGVTRKMVVAMTAKGNDGFPRSEIRIMDPMGGKLYHTETLQNNERIYALTEWNVKEGKRYICLGTWGYRQAEGRQEQGRVLVYNLKAYEKRDKGPTQQKAVMYKMKQLGEMVLDGPVHCISSFLGSYLLASAGETFHQLKIDALTRKLVVRASLTLRWPIQSINARGSRVVIGGQKESVLFYDYDVQSKTFEFMKSDRYARATADCIIVDDDTAVATDKDGGIVGLVSGDPTGLERTLETAFCYNLGEAVMRLRLGSIVQHAITKRISPDSNNPEMATDRVWDFETLMSDGWGVSSDASNITADETGVDGKVILSGPKVIYGCSMLGSLFAILKISAEVYEMLKILQVIIGGHPQTRPVLGNDHVRYRSQGINQKTRGCIDGELIAQFVSLNEEAKAEIVDIWNERWRSARPLLAESRGTLAVADMMRLIVRLDNSCS